MRVRAWLACWRCRDEEEEAPARRGDDWCRIWKASLEDLSNFVQIWKGKLSERSKRQIVDWYRHDGAMGGKQGMGEGSGINWRHICLFAVMLVPALFTSRPPYVALRCVGVCSDLWRHHKTINKPKLVPHKLLQFSSPSPSPSPSLFLFLALRLVLHFTVFYYYRQWQTPDSTKFEPNTLLVAAAAALCVAFLINHTRFLLIFIS